MCLLGGLAAAPQAAAQTFTCGVNFVYSIRSATGEINRVNTSTGAYTVLGTLPPAPSGLWNGMGIQARGDTLYAVQTPGGRVLTYDVAADTSTISPAPSTSGYSGSFLVGGVNPANGWFYTASAVEGSASNTSWGLFAYNPAWGSSQAPIRVGTIPALGNNGDLAFDGLGNLYLLSGNIGSPSNGARVYRVDRPIPTTSSSSELSTTQLTEALTHGSFNYGGIAFSNGLLVLQVGNAAATGDSTYFRVDPASGELVGSSFTSAGGGDLASCQNPYTISLQKDLPSGRVVAGNQFRLAITGGGITLGNTATTSGSATGLQTAVAGPVLGQPGTTYTVRETAVGATVLANYASSLQCVNETTGANVAVTANAAGNSATFVMPSTSAGADIMCTLTNRAPILRLRKALPSGRIVTGDQFALRIVGGSSNVSVNTTGSTNAPTQTATVSPAALATAYTLSEVGVASTNLGAYASTYSCSNTLAGGQTPSGNGTSFTVTPVVGDELTCTFSNARRTADLQVVKTASPTGALRAGQIATYTIVATNNGPSAADGAVLSDAPVGLDCSNPATTATCTAAGGASCPSPTVPIASLTGSGITLSPFPNAGSVTLVMQCTVLP